MPGYIHHVEWCVSDLQGQVSGLVAHYGFQVIGQRTRRLPPSWIVQQVAVKSGETIFIITQKSFSSDISSVKKVKDDEYPIFTCCEDSKEHRRDTVFNVALVVGDHLDDILQGIIEKDGMGSVLLPIKSTQENRIALVKSCCGNVVHTLMDKKCSLPGFEAVYDQTFGLAWNDNLLKTSHMDHITYVCQAGDSQRILRWYAELFGMRRFYVNPQESEDGVAIEGDVNLRLTVGEWLSSWLCREEGVCNDSENEKMNFKLVLAEPVDNCKDSHVKNFLLHHGGPGLQHIGLTTPNAAETVRVMANHGAQFRKPPPTYYKLASKINEIQNAGEDVDQVADLGLLFDAEADVQSLKNEEMKILVQIFSKPVFGQDTFFLEILERRGARGFGSGNITALAQSIILYQRELSLQK